MAAPTKPGWEAANRDWAIAARKNKSSTPVGRLVFVILRLIDVGLQYGVLAWGWADPLIKLFGGKPLPFEGPVVALGLPIWRLWLFAMVSLAAVKEISYLLFITEAAMPVRTACFVVPFKALWITINNILFAATATSGAKGWHPGMPIPLFLGISFPLFGLGYFLELYSELQRMWFKADAKNAGKPFTGGLFSLARHINYTGYSTWKTAAALSSSGWLWGLFSAFYLLKEFRRRVIPPLNEYCQDRVSNLPLRLLDHIVATHRITRKR